MFNDNAPDRDAIRENELRAATNIDGEVRWVGPERITVTMTRADFDRFLAYEAHEACSSAEDVDDAYQDGRTSGYSEGRERAVAFFEKLAAAS